MPSLAEDVFGELGLSITDLRAANKLHLLVEWSAVVSRFEDAREEAQLAAGSTMDAGNQSAVEYFVRNVAGIKSAFDGISKNKEGRFAPVGALYDALHSMGSQNG